MPELSLCGLKIEVKLATSAFKHGYAENDLLSVILNNIYDETL
jgi:hypothetical protein